MFGLTIFALSAAVELPAAAAPEPAAGRASAPARGLVVNSTPALEAALKTARPGAVIRLANGLYAPVSLNGLHLKGVVVTSEKEDQPAVLTGLTVNNCSGLTFRKLTFRTAPLPKMNSYLILNSQDIVLDRLLIHGSLDGDPGNDGNGLIIHDSSNISVTNSELEQLADGIAHFDSDHLNFSGNNLHDIREDGIRGGGSSFVTVSGNTFRDFYPRGEVGTTGDHADAIQFWTTNTKVSAHDLTITDNVFQRGAGRYAQGVFMGEEVGTLPYKHVTISGNLVVGGMYNGIDVHHAEDVTITRNVIAGFTDRMSWIRLIKVNGAVVMDNQANRIVTEEEVTNLNAARNKVTDLAKDGGQRALRDWKQAHPNDPRGDLLSQNVRGGAVFEEPQ